MAYDPQSPASIYADDAGHRFLYQGGVYYASTPPYQVVSVLPLSYPPNTAQMSSLILDFLGQGMFAGLTTLAPAGLFPAITFARADASTCATYIDFNGILQSAAANIPRFDYNPSTLAPLGLLIEESRQNIFLNSLLNGTSLSTQNITVTAAPWTVSFYGTGTITFSGAFTGSLVGSAVYPTRSTVTFIPSAGTLTCTVTGSVQYAQAELGAFATSFIPTAGAAVTRAADAASMTGTNFSSWFNASQGTFVSQWDISNTTADAFVFDVNTSGGGTYLYSHRRNTSNQTIIRQRDGSTHDLPITGTPVVGALMKFASSYNISTPIASGSVNGGTVATSTTNAWSGNTGVNQMQIGVSGGSGYLNGHVRSLTYFPYRLTDTQLQTLTT